MPSTRIGNAKQSPFLPTSVVLLLFLAACCSAASVHKSADEVFAAAGVDPNSMRVPGKPWASGPSSNVKINDKAADKASKQAPFEVSPVLDRGVKRVVSCVQSVDGDGATVCRAIGNRKIRRMDPFLMLDHFSVTPPAGFPNHPHRGFETVTYMLENEFRHEDSMGNAGTIGPGDVQWMTAGSGVIHSEFPAGGTEAAVGMQLWVNLPKKYKMTEPKYQEIKASGIPVAFLGEGASAKVIAGSLGGVTGPATAHTPILVAHLTIPAGTSYTIPVDRQMDGFVYVIQGSGQFGPEETLARKGSLIELAKSSGSLQAHDRDVPTPPDNFEVAASLDADLEVYVGLGVPIGEPVSQQGPFVMNTETEIRKAWNDYRNGKLVKTKARTHDEL